ncbi:MAG: carbamoyltransferase HypF [Pseudomonadota bacterium]|nr:carbamoyltransferase HypF [Pseudomonadota bacterium]
MHERVRRLRLICRGHVQGVGLRPYVYRRATELALGGWVVNSAGEVRIEVQGSVSAMAAFLRDLRCIPPPARIDVMIRQARPLEAAVPFRIRSSAADDPAGMVIAPDLATCPACRAELFDPTARRYRYPFTTCSQCGPRWSILRRLPFDRDHTAMAGFPLCAQCRAEYENPADRRFHAQTLACPACGPALTWHQSDGAISAGGEDALDLAVAALRQGRIVAVKGIGGFHLLTDARDEAAVARLRVLKARPTKPLAVLFPDLDQAGRSGHIGATEAALLTSAAAPIVLLARREDDPLGRALAPGLDRLGALLPYSPLHHLLMAALGFPVVATSANRKGAPLCFENGEALRELSELADGFLLHDRAILRPVEDSVVQVFAHEALRLRLGRGDVPVTLALPRAARPVLGVGGQWKNTVALTVKDRLVIGGYRGDLDHPQAQAAWAQECAALPALFGATPRTWACDAHPDYVPTREASRLAREGGFHVSLVQHHHAHLAAAIVEGRCTEPLLGVVWDGTGLGSDGTIWGGELLAWEAGRVRRIGALFPFALPGGDAAVRDPRRSALGVLAALGEPLDGPLARSLGYDAQSLRILTRMLETGAGCVTTTSAGRLFDAVAALLGHRGPVSYEGEAAMTLEALARRHPEMLNPYPISGVTADASGWIIMDWQGALLEALAEQQAGRPAGHIAARWHVTLAALIAEAVVGRREQAVVLAGGCFQNTLLLGRTVHLLRAQGRRVFWPCRLPVNDGALAAGQAAVVAGVWGG